jgi:hypothetical protein
MVLWMVIVLSDVVERRRESMYHVRTDPLNSEQTELPEASDSVSSLLFAVLLGRYCCSRRDGRRIRDVVTTSRIRVDGLVRRTRQDVPWWLWVWRIFSILMETGARGSQRRVGKCCRQDSGRLAIRLERRKAARIRDELVACCRVEPVGPWHVESGHYADRSL